jgi:hypothetical protein
MALDREELKKLLKEKGVKSLGASPENWSSQKWSFLASGASPEN